MTNDLCSRGCGRRRSRRGLCAACYETRRTRDTAYGRWETLYTDATPVRAHIAALRAAGMGTRAIAAAAGVNRQNIQQALIGRPDRGTPPSRKMLRRIADAILAVPVPEVPHSGVAAGARVSAVGTTRRLRALVAIGWTQAALCEQLGWKPENGSRLFRGATTTVTAATAQKVAALYDNLSMTPGPSLRARAHAQTQRWAPPLAWDDTAIDNPNARPDRARGRKGGFVERYTELVDLGYSQIDCARRMGITWASLQEQLNRHGLPVGQELRDIAHEQRLKRKAG